MVCSQEENILNEGLVLFVFVANEEDFSNYLFKLDKELEIISETGDTFTGGRTAAFWVRDMLCLTQLITNKNEPPRDLDYMLFKLIAFCPALYGDFDSLNQSYVQMRDMYNCLLAARDHFTDICHTLIKVERQQGAKERAGRSENKPTKIEENAISQFRDHYWNRPLEKDHSFFRDIANCALEFEKDILEFFPTRRESSDYTEADWCKNIEGIFSRITYYPVSSMLMPVLLTKYIVDNGGYDSVYAFMKYLKSSFPRNKSVAAFKQNIQLLYDAIVNRLKELNSDWIDFVEEWHTSEVQKNLEAGADHYPEEETHQVLFSERAKAASLIPADKIFRAMDSAYHEQRRTVFQRGLPIISFPDILDILEQKFKDNHYPYDKAQLWRELSKYTEQNGLSFSDSKTNYTEVEQIIISIAQLCNAESYLNYKCRIIPNKAVQAALKKLEDKHIIERKAVESEPDSSRYLSLYEKFCVTFPISEEDLSPLALCKYFKLDLWSALERIEFFKTLQLLMTENLTDAKEGILSVFYSTSEKSYCTSYVPPDAYDDLLKLFGIMKKGLLARKKGTATSEYESELERLVADPDNLTYFGFQKFIESIDSTEKLWKGFHIPIQYKEEIICGLFNFTIDLIMSVLLDQIRQYCVKQIEWYSKEDVNDTNSATIKETR